MKFVVGIASSDTALMNINTGVRKLLGETHRHNHALAARIFQKNTYISLEINNNR
jgi:hypothetical protein